jgi:hypothetical protein
MILEQQNVLLEMLPPCDRPLRSRGERVIFDAFDFHVIAESLKVAANILPKAKQTCFHGAAVLSLKI